MENLKIQALEKHLECEASDIKEDGIYFYLGNQEYMILTDEEADEVVEERISNDIWAFRASFILSECGLPLELEEGIQAMQEKKCEDANDALLRMVEKTCGLKSFVEAAVSADGRGHFLSGYDGEEVEVRFEGETFYIYRLN